MRQIAKGRSLGSSRRCWILPCQVNRWPLHQVLDVDGAVVRQTELPKRHLEGGFLHVVRIEVDGDQDQVLAVRR